VELDVRKYLPSFPYWHLPKSLLFQSKLTNPSVHYKVRNVGLNGVLSNNPYILFYELVKKPSLTNSSSSSSSMKQSIHHMNGHEGARVKGNSMNGKPDIIKLNRAGSSLISEARVNGEAKKNENGCSSSLDMGEIVLRKNLNPLPQR